MSNLAQGLFGVAKRYAAGEQPNGKGGIFGALAYKMSQNPAFQKKYGQGAMSQTTGLPGAPQQPSMYQGQGELGNAFRTSKGFDPTRYFSDTVNSAGNKKFDGWRGVFRYMGDRKKFEMQQGQQPMTQPTRQIPLPQQTQFQMNPMATQGMGSPYQMMGGQGDYGQQSYPMQNQMQGQTMGQRPGYNLQSPQLGDLLRSLGIG